MIHVFRKKVMPAEPAFRQTVRVGHNDDPTQLKDLIFGLSGDTMNPYKVFDQLRWGGQFVFISPDFTEVSAKLAEFNNDGGYIIETAESTYKTGFPLFSKTWHYFVARKVNLIHPGEITNRFTFNVSLVLDKTPGQYVVLKQVPDQKAVYKRLCEKFPDVDDSILAKRAHKLCDHVFPVFLSRETAFLQLLQRELPAPYNNRFPAILMAEAAGDGLVRRMQMNWLRMGCDPLTHIEFARQSADLLRVLHDSVGVIHLDLRLDNFVITPNGVSFVDFGSAVRVGEQLRESPLLRSLFDEMMSTSKIQKQLGRMIQTGKVTSSYIAGAHQKIDKAIDLFYLAIQLKKPHANPDFVGLVDVEPDGEVARQLAGLAARVLRPRDPKHAKYQSAADLVQGINRIEQRIMNGNGAA